MFDILVDSEYKTIDRKMKKTQIYHFHVLFGSDVLG